ncbi:MAG: Rieske (2Fe-2S) protein [Chloroflexi bacterium]|nr:Rieske (2Fe-2S) protein [Chloroflexota bacterium]MDA1239232.1 Rieske (2Fe-2S) protein [Chloroflexota bacterium]
MRRALLVLLAISASAALIAITAGFVWSGMTDGRTVNLGRISDFPSGSVTTFTPLDGDGAPVLGWSRRSYLGDVPGAPLQVHIVHLDDGELVAFIGISPHLGCRVDWRPDAVWEGMTGVFLDPCYSSRWARDGTRIFGPTPRDLGRVAIEVTEDGRVLLHADKVGEGEWRAGRIRSAPSRDHGPVEPTALATAPAQPAP